jgi:hypothetical protein
MFPMDMVFIFYLTFMFNLGLKANIHVLKVFHIHNYKVSIIKFLYLNKKKLNIQVSFSFVL